MITQENTHEKTHENDSIARAGEALRSFFAAPFRPRTYTNLLYLLLAFPLGLAYFLFLTVGLMVGFALTIVWVGIPLLALVFAGTWAFAAFERQAAIHLLGAEVPPMAPLPTGAARSAWQRAGDFFSNPVTWKGMGFLLLKFPLGLVSFVATVVSLSVSTAFLFAPLFWDRESFQLDTVFFQVDSPATAWACALLGLGLLFLALNLLNALGRVWRGTAALMLGSERFVAAVPPAPAVPDGVAMA
jgi:hypothetical protein